MSAILPNGTRKTAADSRYEVATQLSRNALIEYSLDIEGRATLTDDAVNGVKNELRTDIAKALLFSLHSAIGSPWDADALDWISSINN